MLREFLLMENFIGRDSMDNYDILKFTVSEYLASHAKECDILDLYKNESSRNHIINIGVSILGTKWKLLPQGGGFVTAFVDNDLIGAMCRADHIVRRALYFYALMDRNVSIPREITN